MTARAWFGRYVPEHYDAVGDLFVAATRGQARRAAALEFGVDFAEPALRVTRAPQADAFIDASGSVARVPAAVCRALGFTDEDGRTCDTCGLGNPPYADADPLWAICGECCQCGECGCDCEEET